MLGRRETTGIRLRQNTAVADIKKKVFSGSWNGSCGGSPPRPQDGHGHSTCAAGDGAKCLDRHQARGHDREWLEPPRAPRRLCPAGASGCASGSGTRAVLPFPPGCVVLRLPRFASAPLWRWAVRCKRSQRTAQRHKGALAGAAGLAAPASAPGIWHPVAAHSWARGAELPRGGGSSLAARSATLVWG